MADLHNTQIALIAATCRPAGEFDISGRGLRDALECRMTHVDMIGRALVDHLQALVDEARQHSCAFNHEDAQHSVDVISDYIADLTGAFMKAADAREVA